MKKNICLILTVIMMISIVFPSAVVFAENDVTAAGDKLAAFPGAEGGGMWTTGARGGEDIDVYHVTRLDDDMYNVKKGMFRDAVSKPNRIIVFDVAGTIELKGTLTISSNNLTILGQTAPGDGICFKNYSVVINADNIIMRYLRFRLGDDMKKEADSVEGQGHQNIIVDHCSMSWSVDECVSLYDNKNFTLQWCIISESLKKSVHVKDNHGYGGIWGGVNASYHHNLIADHDSRNPRIDPRLNDDADKDVMLTDLRNNVVYNWGGNSAYGAENLAPVNIVNCYYKYGPSTSDKNSVKSRIFQLSALQPKDENGDGDPNGYVANGKVDAGVGPDLYVSGNYIDGSSSVTSDNSKGVNRDEKVTGEYYVRTSLTGEAKTVHERYFEDYPIITQTALEAYESVLADAGASIARDSVDTRIINDVKNRTGGLINSPNDVGGYPELSGIKAKDSDNDGIPNEWEDNNGLNKMDASDGVKIAASGYTYIEEYANALADGSYTRDVGYDPDVSDYEPEPDVSADPDTTASPQFKIVDSWIASSANQNALPGTEFMPGLTPTFKFDNAGSGVTSFSDGSEYSYFVTGKSDYNGIKASAGWENGKAKGAALRYEAPQDGRFTMYLVALANKTYYVMKEGAESYDEAVFSQAVSVETPFCTTIDIKKGEVYYFLVDGSKARFMAAKLEEEVLPYEFSRAELDSSGILSVELSQNDASVTGGKLIVAGFTSENILKDVNTYEIENGSVKDLDYTKPADIDHVNLYIWNNENNIIPLSLSVQNLK